MENNEERLQKIIAVYAPFDYTKIDLKIKIKDKYVAASFKHSFCADICTAWKKINSTKLHNDMFNDLKTGEDIIKIIKEKYS